MASDPEGARISFLAVEVPTEEEVFPLLGAMGVPVASFGHLASGKGATDTSDLFGGFRGVTGEEIVDQAVLNGGAPVRGDSGFEGTPVEVWRLYFAL